MTHHLLISKAKGVSGCLQAQRSVLSCQWDVLLLYNNNFLLSYCQTFNVRNVSEVLGYAFSLAIAILNILHSCTLPCQHYLLRCLIVNCLQVIFLLLGQNWRWLMVLFFSQLSILSYETGCHKWSVLSIFKVLCIFRSLKSLRKKPVSSPRWRTRSLFPPTHSHKTI